jgi:hypothetical protein
MVQEAGREHGVERRAATTEPIESTRRPTAVAATWCRATGDVVTSMTIVSTVSRR